MRPFGRLRAKAVATVVSMATLYVFLYIQSSIMSFSKGPCECTLCMTAAGNDSWFSERYKPSVEPLLSRKNSAITDDVYRWWQSLQHERNPANYTVVVKQLLKLFPDNKRYIRPRLDRCRTCAVVGNSGNLLGSHYGRLIDLHDFVLRMNRAPTKGFEEDVGAKTTHRIIYPESAMDMENSTHLVLAPFKTLDLQWLISAFTTKNITRTYTGVRASIQADKSKVMVLSPVFIKYVYESWLQKHGRYPSTGFLTLVFALHVCDEVNVYGFGADRNGKWHHYFEKMVVNYNHTPHGGNYEYETVVQLSKKNKIQMFKGF